MKVLFYTLIVLSLTTLGAHFYRYGSEIVAFASVALIGLLFVRRPWAARVLQVALVLGALEWIWTTYELVQFRLAVGGSTVRLVAILGAVTVITFVSALLFQSKTLKSVYRLDDMTDRNA